MRSSLGIIALKLLPKNGECILIIFFSVSKWLHKSARQQGASSRVQKRECASRLSRGVQAGCIFNLWLLPMARGIRSRVGKPRSTPYPIVAHLLQAYCTYLPVHYYRSCFYSDKEAFLFDPWLHAPVNTFR